METDKLIGMARDQMVEFQSRLIVCFALPCANVFRPDHFIVVNKMTAGSKIQNLHIRNWPTHLFSISSCSNLVLQNLLLDNSAGDAPNAISGGLAAAHNSDGFDLSTSSNVLITNNTVYNQDDCVAITSGNNVTVSNMYCSGGHGLSIGSVGGKSNNNVTNILVGDPFPQLKQTLTTPQFTNSKILNSQNGARIKSNYNTTGFISNITYSNIAVSNISIYGIDVQQDYLNGGPTGIPSNGVIISNLLFQNLTGTAAASGEDYYILCGSGSCSNFVFNDVDIVGGGKTSSCNFPPSGCPGP
jgi:polygalacturonase